MVNDPPAMLTWSSCETTPEPTSLEDQEMSSGALSSTRPVPKWTVGAVATGRTVSGPTVTVRVPLSVRAPSLTT